MQASGELLQGNKKVKQSLLGHLRLDEGKKKPIGTLIRYQTIGGDIYSLMQITVGESNVCN